MFYKLHLRHFRVRFLLDTIPVVLMPGALCYLVMIGARARLGVSVPWALRPLAYVASIVLLIVARDAVSHRQQVLAARRAGARLAPRLEGKWPGNIDMLMLFAKGMQGYVMAPFGKVFEEHKTTTINLHFLWRDVYLTMDEGVIKYALATGFRHFDKGNPQKEILEGFLGDGIFNSDGARWKMHRAMTRPFFARERISDFDIIERHTDETLRLLSSLSLPSRINPTGALDVQDLLLRFSLDTASEFLFGSQLRTLRCKLPVAGEAKMGLKGSATEDEFGSFANAFETLQTVIQVRFKWAQLWPMAEMFHDKNKESKKIIYDYLEPLVQKAMEDHKAAKARGDSVDAEHTTLLGYLVANTDDKQLIHDELLNILLAARDTTSTTLTFVIYFLALHPDVCTKLREEIIRVNGPDAPPTYESIKEMKYTRAVLNETLRLFPPVPGNQRRSCSTPCVIPSSTPGQLPLYMPANTGMSGTSPSSNPTDSTPDLSYTPILMHRRADLWGPDSLEFDPERWIDEARVKKFLANPMMFLPFNAGPRICLGQQFAYNEMSYFLVRLLQRFLSVELTPQYQPEGSLPPLDWQSEPGRQPIEKIWPRAAVTLYIKGGMWARFKRVDE